MSWYIALVISGAFRGELNLNHNLKMDHKSFMNICRCMCGIVFFYHMNSYDNELTGAFTRCNCLFHAMCYPFIRIVKLSVLSDSFLICIDISCLNGDA